MIWSNGLRRKYVSTIIGLALLLVFLFPLYWMLVTSFKTSGDILSYPPRFIPSSPSLQAWEDLFSTGRIFRYFLNSAIVATGTTALTLVLACPAAYGLARFRLKGGSIVMSLCLTSLMFPAIVLALPLFAIFSRLGLANTYAGLILADTTASLPFVIVILRPLAASIPGEIIEAARTDGCSELGAFLRIALPLSTPGIFTAIIFSFLFGWSDFVFALSLVNDDSMRPVTAGLWLFMGVHNTDWGGLMAFSALAMLPPLIIFLLAQRYVVGGLAAGAVK